MQYDSMPEGGQIIGTTDSFDIRSSHLHPTTLPLETNVLSLAVGTDTNFLPQIPEHWSSLGPVCDPKALCPLVASGERFRSISTIPRDRRRTHWGGLRRSPRDMADVLHNTHGTKSFVWRFGGEGPFDFLPCSAPSVFSRVAAKDD